MTAPPSATELPGDTHIGRTALRVAAPNEMVAFYRDVVGLSVRDRSGDATTLGVEDGPLLVLEADPDAPPRHGTATGLYHNAVRVPSRGALGDALARIRDNWHLGGASDHAVSEALYLTDPEGNGVEIYRDRPREDWPRRADGTVDMVTDPLDFAPIEAAATGADRAPAGTAVGHVHLEVSSLDSFTDFYVDTLGFDVQATVPSASFVGAGGYHHHVGANTWQHRTGPAEGRGLAWFELVVPAEAALGAISERLAEGGWSFTETADGIAVDDQDGNEIRIRVAGTA